MEVNISGRHFEVSDALERHIRHLASKLPRLDGKLQRLDVTLTMDGSTASAEVYARCHRADLVARTAGHDMYGCVEEAFERLRTQVHRLHDRIVHHKGAGTDMPPTP